MLYFITETYLKTNTPITANVDVTDVTPYIATQAQLRVMPILGTVFYDDLLTKYNAQTLDPDEEILVAFIHPVYHVQRLHLAWSTMLRRHHSLK
jgi:hypothetical protein